MYIYNLTNFRMRKKPLPLRLSQAVIVFAVLA